MPILVTTPHLIISSHLSAYHRTIPPPPSSFVPFACLYDGGFDHFDALLLESLVPLALLAAAMALELGLHISAEVKKRRPNGMSGGTVADGREPISSSQIEEAKVQHHTFANFMMLLFLVLPVIAKRVCQSFRCVDFDGGDNEEHIYLAVSVRVEWDGVVWVGLVRWYGSRFLSLTTTTRSTWRSTASLSVTK